MTNAPEGLLLKFPAGTLGGEYATATETAIAGGAPAGTFFDYAVVHLITTSTLARLQSAYPEGVFAIERFRPNLVVDTGSADAGFLENGWIGKTLAIGDELLLRLTIP